MNDTDIIKYVVSGGTGAGGSAVAMWYWIKNRFAKLEQQNDQQLDRLKNVEKINSDLLLETKVQTSLLTTIVQRGAKMNGG